MEVYCLTRVCTPKGRIPREKVVLVSCWAVMRVARPFSAHGGEDDQDGRGKRHEHPQDSNDRVG